MPSITCVKFLWLQLIRSYIGLVMCSQIHKIKLNVPVRPYVTYLETVWLLYQCMFT